MRGRWAGSGIPSTGGTSILLEKRRSTGRPGSANRIAGPGASSVSSAAGGESLRSRSSVRTTVSAKSRISIVVSLSNVMNIKALSLVLGAVAVFFASGTQAQPGGPLPPLFPPDNWWNVDVSSAPVDPKSGQFLDFIGRGTQLHPDFGGFADSPPETYGVIYLSVPGTQPLVPVTFVEFGDESDT